MEKIKYNTSIERLEILKKAEQKGWNLKEEANLTNESYLIFDTKTEEKIIQLETALLESTTLLANEQMKNQQNEQAISELTMMLGGM